MSKLMDCQTCGKKVEPSKVVIKNCCRDPDTHLICPFCRNPLGKAEN